MQKERLKYQKEYMESIKKLEEQLMMNQRSYGRLGSEKVDNGPKDDSSNLTSNKEVF